MNTRRRLALLASATLAAALLAGCSAADDASTAPRPAALAEFPSIVLSAPEATGAGPSPTFAWEAVPGAVEYRLSILTTDGPIWGWSGDATSVVYGGYSAAPAEGVGVLRLSTAAWWSVAALDADGEIVAVSDHRAVSPDDTAPIPLGATDEPSEPVTDDEPLASACELFSDAEAEEFLEGPLAGPGEGGVESDGRTLFCSWERADDELLTLDLSIQPGVLRESWDESMQIMLESDPAMPHAFEGVGDDSYMEVDWGGTKLALIDGDVYLSVRSGFTGGAEQATIDVATQLLERYRERAS